MMKSSFTGAFNLELSGQSHDEFFTITMDGVQAGIKIDLALIERDLTKRKPRLSFNTKRCEHDAYEISGGLIKKDDYYLTDGKNIKIKFFNHDIKTHDYDILKDFDRPGHVDYVARLKYPAHALAGGGHFSGRLTAGLVFMGALVKQIIRTKITDFDILTHISKCLGIEDDTYYSKDLTTNYQSYLTAYYDHDILMFDKDKYQLLLRKMKSVEYNFGGQLETIIINVPSLLGATWFNSLEAKIAQFIFSIPALKGIVFGAYLDYDEQHNYEQIQGYQEQPAKLITKHNYDGGINGGISTGEAIVFTTFLKPIATQNKEILTYSKSQKKLAPLRMAGRHDQSIINRLIPIINAGACLAIYDELLQANYFNIKKAPTKD